MKKTRLEISILISLIAIIAGIVLRWAQLGNASLWFDEGYTAWVVSLPARGIINAIRVDTAPPLYYLLLHGWSLLFGRSEAGMRSMSALMATVGLVFFAAISGRLFKSGGAKAAAISLFSVSFMQIAYAHEARFYAMMTMVGAIDLYLVLRVCERVSGMRIITVIFAWTLSLYTNNLMAIYLACLGIAWLVLPGERAIRARLRDLAIVSIISAILFAPWVPAALAQAHRIQGKFWPAVPDGSMLMNTIRLLSGVEEQNALLFTLATIALAFAIVTSRSAAHFRRAIALLCFGFLPVLIVFFYSRFRQSIFVERAFLPSGIAISLLAGLAIDAARTKLTKSMAGVSVFVLFCLCVPPIPGHLQGEHPEAWREACAFAQNSPAKRRLVICVASDGEPLYRYYARNSDYALRADVTAVPASFFAANPPRTMMRTTSDRDLDSVRSLLKSGAFDEVVLMASHTWWGDPDQRTLRLLSSQLKQVDRRVFPAITVFRYQF